GDAQLAVLRRARELGIDAAREVRAAGGVEVGAVEERELERADLVALSLAEDARRLARQTADEPGERALEAHEGFPRARRLVELEAQGNAVRPALVPERALGRERLARELERRGRAQREERREEREPADDEQEREAREGRALAPEAPPGLPREARPAPRAHVASSSTMRGSSSVYTTSTSVFSAYTSTV